MISILATQAIAENSSSSNTLETAFLIIGAISAILLISAGFFKKNQKMMSTLGTIAMCGLFISIAGLLGEIFKDSAAENSEVSNSITVNIQNL